MRAKAPSGSRVLTKIAKLGYVPIDSNAAHGVVGGSGTKSAVPSPLPLEGIDCSNWDRIKLNSFFCSRYPFLSSQSITRLVDSAIKDGHIEGAPSGYDRGLGKHNKVGSLHFFKSLLGIRGGGLRASEVVAILKAADPALKGSALKLKVNEVLSGKTSIARAKLQVANERTRSLG
jgi:hypothetical protein